VRRLGSHEDLHPMSAYSGKVLFDESPIAVSRSAARLFGLPEAAFLQQLHYRLHIKKQDPKAYASYFIDGRFWVRWSMEELQREIPLGRSDDPFKRVIRKLRDLRILMVEQLSESKWNKTNFYSIDYAVLEALVSRGQGTTDPTGGDATDRSGEKPGTNEDDLDESIGGDATDHYSKSSTKTSTNTTTKGTTTERLGGSDGAGELLWTVVPMSIRSKILGLIAHAPDQQRCVDLLAARISLDQTLPREQRLGSPVKWFTRVMADPDFSAGDQYAEERRREQTREAASIDETKATLESKAEQGISVQKREEAALAKLAMLDQDTLLEVSALAAAVCEYPPASE
jgi:hypothetical protein